MSGSLPDWPSSGGNIAQPMIHIEAAADAKANLAPAQYAR